MLPDVFLKKMHDLLGPEAADFEAALVAPPPVSVRFNPFKKGEKNAPAPAGGHPIDWHPLGFYLDQRPVFTLDPRFHAGAYYVQEASSMFLHEALRQTVDFSKKLKIMDLCAAPGGKSTLLASMMNAESLLLANEVIRTRTAPLRENLEKWGCPNVAVSSADPSDFEPLEGWFDVVVADAPCSGEGLFRKDPEAAREWSPANVEVCAGRQRRILAAAVTALAPGGVLAFSTCTFNTLENEENAAWLLENFDLEPLSLALPASWGIAAGAVIGSGGVANTFRFYPHRLRGEGFFLSIFRKKTGEVRKQVIPTVFKSLKPLPKNLLPELDRWVENPEQFRFFQTPSGEVLALPATLEGEFLILDKHLKTKWFGTRVGSFKGKDFVPDHALALSIFLKKDLPAVHLAREQALLFLKKENFNLPENAPAAGWALARFEGLNLGWLKMLPNRFNNYLPPERRIRMKLEV